MARNVIRFGCQRRDDSGALEVVPVVDGVPLTELIDRFETDAGMRPAGGAYAGLVPQFFMFGPMDDQFRGRSAGAMGPKTPLLGCVCGEWGCWPLMAHVALTAGHVVWDCFEQPHRTERDYTALGPFRFARRQYYGALRDLSAVIGAAST